MLTSIVAPSSAWLRMTGSEMYLMISCQDSVSVWWESTLSAATEMLSSFTVALILYYGGLLEVENAVIVVIVCDRGDRYLSTDVFPAD